MAPNNHDETRALRDGDVVDAVGTVVALPGRAVRFCAFAPRTLQYPPAAPAYCEYGVDAVGVDLDVLTDRRDADRGAEGVAVAGTARLRGTYRNGVVEVSDQSPPPAPAGVRTEPYDDPPGPPPPGGWATDGREPDPAAVQRYAEQHPDVIVEIAFARPGPDQVVLSVLTPGDPAQVRQALAADYDAGHLCVATSTVTDSELLAARSEPAFAVEHPTGVFSAGVGRSRNGQLQLQLAVTMVTPELAAAVSRHAPGVVSVRAWLTSVRAPR